MKRTANHFGKVCNAYRIWGIILVFFLCLWCATASAWGEPITVQVAGVVNSIDFPTDSVQVGSSMVGFCSYDTETPDEDPSDYRGTYALNHLSMAIGDYTFTHNSASAQPALFDVWKTDMTYRAQSLYGIATESGLPLSFYKIHIKLIDLCNASVGGPDDLLPVTFPDISFFTWRNKFEVTFSQSGTGYQIQGELTSIEVVSEPPLPRVIYVDDDAPSGGDGQSWPTAYKYLQDAMAASLYGDEVWVAEGTYTPDANSLIPDGSGDRAATFRLKNGIALYGGFPSGGGTLPIRDPNRYETILSGDLDENDEPVPYPKDLLSHFSRAENSYTVVKNIGTAGYAILDGFIITAGQSDGGIFNFESYLTIANCRLVNNSASYYGGAISNFANSRLNMTNCIITGNSTNREGGAISNIFGSLTLINCVISDNFANGNGGGIVNKSGTVTLDGCTFTNNWAEGAGGAVLGSWGSSSSLSLTATDCVFNANSAGNIGGGGIYWSHSREYSEMLLTDCTFTENSVRGTGDFANGGGILAEGLNSLILNNCSFIGNSANNEGSGGGVYNSHDYRYSLDQKPEFTDCTFVGNSAYWGAGLYNWGSSPEITNCTFSNNEAQVAGGAMGNYEHSSPTVTNCTFNGNSANNEDHGSTGWGGAVANFYGASPTVVNCAFRNNFAGEFGGAISNSDVTIIENCIFTGNSTYYKGGAMYNNFREGNITVTNCLFTANTAYWGGGIHNYGSHPIITNCTFAQNRATYGDALGCEDGSSIELTNCILWDGQDQIHYPDSLLITITYSDVQGGWPDVGNISAEPLFIDPNGPDGIIGTEDDNFRLIGNSPCIDVGDNLIVDPNAKDLDGNPRIVNSIVDMGAYEHQLPRVIYVDDDAPPGGDGLTWPTAYKYLQDALDDAGTGDEIWVSAGTYYPTYDYRLGIGSRGKHFRMKNGVAIYGGFDGTETSLAERNVQNNETILSGDIGTSGDNTDNCYHVFYHPSGTNLDATAILDGFTVTSGNAGDNSEPHNDGGGMYNDYSSPTVTNCTFSGNLAGWSGAGMYNDNSSSPIVTNCTFSGNSAHYDIAGGGGMYNLDSSSPTVTGCSFVDNSADIGGGMFNNHNSNPTVSRCTFVGNSASFDGGGMYNMGNSSPIVTNCTFTGNSAYSDGWGGGGGMYNSSSSLTVTNCTFGGNLAIYNGGGMYNEWSNNLTVTNCILWGNTASEGNEIYNDISYPVISYCDITGSGGSGAGWNSFPFLGLDGGGNIDAEPLFIDADGADNTPGTEDDNLRLQAGSLCIDVGDNSAVTAATDLDGNPRIVNDTVDMGAYEFFHANTAPVADAGEDQTVFACVDGIAEVKLDGSGSYDDDGDELDYFWFEGDEQIATGVDPNVQLSVGEHIIELIVNDGTEDSEPDDVTIAIVGMEEPGLYYDVTFSSPEHVAGLPPSVGYLSTRPTKIVFGEPLVEPSLGELSGQPLVFNTTGNNSSFYYEQIRFVVGQEQDYYYVSFDVFVNNLIGSTNRFTVLFDTPTVRNLYFKNDGTIYIENWNNHTRRGESKVIGTFTETEILYVEVKMNLVLQEWEILLNGVQLHIGWFEPDQDIEAIRFNLGLTNSSDTPNHDTYVGLDNIIVANRDMSESQPPVADAGADQTVFAWVDGMAEVKLDGSGSYDVDGDALEYFWFIGDEQIATGVDPNVQLSVGEHIIELIVNDGSEDSEPNAVVITVVGPIEADVHIVPRVINRINRIKRVMAIIRLPAGIGKGDVVRESFELYAGGLDGEPVGAILERVIGRGNMTRVFALFDKGEVMNVVEGVVGGVELTVVGKLTSGQYIQGSDTVRIVKPRRRRGLLKRRQKNRRK